MDQPEEPPSGKDMDQPNEALSGKAMDQSKEQPSCKNTDQPREYPSGEDMVHSQEPSSHNSIIKLKDNFSPNDVDERKDTPCPCNTEQYRNPLSPCVAHKSSEMHQPDALSELDKSSNPTSPSDAGSPRDPSSPSDTEQSLDSPIKVAMRCPPAIGGRKHARLQERRGSNVSLVLDVSVLGMVEPLCPISTPRETILQLLRTSKCPLTPADLQAISHHTQSLDLEYQKIPQNFINASELDIPGRALKDRYKTILPNPETRVCLRGNKKESEDKGYINANYIRGFGGSPMSYIATQGPMVNTVVDFWEMVWQEESAIIVMITELKETKEKCAQYWPEHSDTYGRVSVAVTAVTPRGGYTVQELTVQVGLEIRHVRHYWYSSWLDHQIPDSAGPLLQLVLDVQSHQKTLCNPGPTIVHCSAGIGRTGCFIACSVCCQQLQEDENVDVLGTVCQLRLDRGGMIQTSEQYQFLYSALASYSQQLSDKDPEKPTDTSLSDRGQQGNRRRDTTPDS